jgi:hypothetical protein
MGLILPGNGQSAGGEIIVPGGRRREIKGPTRKYLLTDLDLIDRLKAAQRGGHLRVHAAVPHLVGCSDSGMFGCLHCEKHIYLGETPEDRVKMLAFINDHRGCRAPNRTFTGAVTDFVIEA